MIKAIPYYRVSTQRQGLSGLGLEAQRDAVRRFARHNKFKLLKGYTEVETGKKGNRPVLEKALKQCKEKGAILLIAKQDRLSRKVQFISTLIASGVPYLALDNPSQNKFMAHVMAAWAEHEHDEISARTRDSLKAARKKGVVLGSFCKRVLSKRNIRKANAFAKHMKPIIRQMKREGHTSVRKLVKELNRKKIPTYSGNAGKWQVTTVQNLLKRLEKLKQ